VCSSDLPVLVSVVDPATEEAETSAAAPAAAPADAKAGGDKK
jgi:hypothetical protein